MVVDGAEYVAEPDPFGEFAALFDLNPLEVSEEGLSTSLARQVERRHLGGHSPSGRSSD